MRGVRTFGECAHYVRCIPYNQRDSLNIETAIWCSPDFTMNIKTGTEEDHALLLASIFRTVKFEDKEEFKKAAAEMKKKTRSKKDRENEILALDGNADARLQEEEKDKSSDEDDEIKIEKETAKGVT